MCRDPGTLPSARVSVVSFCPGHEMKKSDPEELPDDDDIESGEKERPSEALEAEVAALEATLPAEPPTVPEENG